MNDSQFIRNMLDSNSRSVSPISNSEHSMDFLLPSTSTQIFDDLVENSSETISFTSSAVSSIDSHSIEDHPSGLQSVASRPYVFGASAPNHFRWVGG